jgi:myo-inositol-1(or 4)-monophosphatase
MSLIDDLNFVKELARGAGRIVLENYGKVSRLTKNHVAASNEAVTDADRASQRFIVAGLRGQFPKDGLIGEESDSGLSITAEIRDPDARTWVIDPIDGTNNFIAGLGAFAVCIGLLDKGMPVLGVVYDVTRGIMYSAAQGHGAFADARPIHALQTPLCDSTMLMLTSNLESSGKPYEFHTRWLNQTNWKIRILGSAAIEATMVAAGVAHGAVTVNGKLWDVAAPAAIVLEAGAIITDIKGKPIFPFDLRNYVGAKVPFLAAGKAAHADLLKEIER